MKKELEQIKQDLYHDRITVEEINYVISEVLLDKERDNQVNCVYKPKYKWLRTSGLIKYRKEVMESIEMLDSSRKRTESNE